jgi:putative endonuclease
MSDPRRSLGQTGEDLAVRTLEAAGLTIVERNWRCSAGELDIVAQETAPDIVTGQAQARWLVLVEVRTRRGRKFGSALESVTPRKRAKLREVAEHYVQSHGWVGPWRIDVVAIQMDKAGRLQSVQHIRHAVSG